MSKVLIIEDDSRLSYLYRVALDFQRLDVLEAASMIDGVKLIKENKPDLVILDLDLPDLNRSDLHDILKQRSKTPMPLIVLTELSGDEAKKEAQELGASFSINPLLNPIGELLVAARSLIKGNKKK